MRAARGVALLSLFLRYVALATLAASAFLAALGQYWIAVLGNVSPFSTGAISGLYLLMDSRLRKDGASPGESIVLSILFANVFAQSFEVIYLFTFPVYLNYFRPPFFDGGDLRYLGLEGVMLVPILLVKRHLRFGALSGALVASFATMWTVWILCGFPQYFTDVFYYPRLLATPDSYHTSLFLDFGSKAILALFFASLAWSPRRGSGGRTDSLDRSQ